MVAYFCWTRLKQHRCIWYFCILGVVLWNMARICKRSHLSQNPSYITANISQSKADDLSSADGHDELAGALPETGADVGREKNGRMSSSFGTTDPYLTPKDLLNSRNESVHVLVLSRTDNYDRRMLIRKTWANSDFYDGPNGGVSLRTIFVVGLSDEAIKNENIKKEAISYGDLLQVNVTDSYVNLVNKLKMAFGWIAKYSNAAYVMKIDDDVIMNRFVWRRLVERLASLDVSCFVLGMMRLETKPRRFGKFGVSVDQYDAEYYPNYCDGPGYMLAADAVATIVERSSRLPVFVMEDVYFTGILVAEAAIGQLAVPPSAVAYLPKPRKISNASVILEQVKGTMLVHRVPVDLWLPIWRVIEQEREGNPEITLRDVTDRGYAVPARWRVKSGHKRGCQFKPDSLGSMLVE